VSALLSNFSVCCWSQNEPVKIELSILAIFAISEIKSGVAVINKEIGGDESGELLSQVK
jgi:hypothetical protein